MSDDLDDCRSFGHDASDVRKAVMSSTCTHTGCTVCHHDHNDRQGCSCHHGPEEARRGDHHHHDSHEHGHDHDSLDTSGQKTSPEPSGDESHHDDHVSEAGLTPLAILDVRLAQGDISIDDFNARRALLASH